jgi:hypothetical protein
MEVKSNVREGPMLSKKSKIEGSENLAKVRFWLSRSP